MALGYHGKLYILAFDHRGSFQKKMFGIDGEPTPEQTEAIADAKPTIHEAITRLEKLMEVQESMERASLLGSAYKRLALIAEIVHGAPSRFSDPARLSFAHGGKDGHPFPVPLQTYDQSLMVLHAPFEHFIINARLDCIAPEAVRIAMSPDK